MKLKKLFLISASWTV